MLFGQCLKAMLPTSVIDINNTQKKPRNRLQKSPPLPKISNTAHFRHCLNKPSPKTPGVWNLARDTLKATFDRHRHMKPPCSVESAFPGADPLPPPHMAKLTPSVDSIQKECEKPRTIVTTPPRPPNQFTRTPKASSKGPCTLEPDFYTFEVAAECHYGGSGKRGLRIFDTDSEGDEFALPKQNLSQDDVFGVDIIDIALNDEDHPSDPSDPEASSGEDEDTGTDEAASAAGSRNTTSSNQSSIASDEVEELTRADWEPLREIPHTNFHQILEQHVLGSPEANEDNFVFVDEIEGGYNFVRIYTILSSEKAGTYVIKVPSVGTAARWQEQDAAMLRSEFGTIKLIRERTQCPVPEVIAYNDTLFNALGAPFILMKACLGVKAADVWYDRLDDGDDDFENADLPSEDCYNKRKTFLASLARAMAELRSLQFDKIGILNFDQLDADGNPTVGPSWHWQINSDTLPEDLDTDQALREQPVFDSSQDLFLSGLRDKWVYDDLEPGRVTATYHILNALFRTSTFADSIGARDHKDTFVLRHDDLDFQNIFCDPETGEVTGIIDWERTSTVPRCIGYTSLPIFLLHDWFPDYSLYSATHPPYSLDSYRDIYAAAMIQATGVQGDGKYTSKSAMYQAAYAAFYGSPAGGSIRHFVRSVLRTVPALCRVDIDEYLDWLGENWATAGEFICNKLPEIAAPSNINEGLVTETP